MRHDAWIGVDLDGTLANYDGWKGPLHIGAPVVLMVETVRGMLRDGYLVKVFTARVAVDDPQLRSEIEQAIQDWCEQHLGVRLEVTNIKDFAMVELWDDRAVRVLPNTGLRADVWKDGETRWEPQLSTA